MKKMTYQYANQVKIAVILAILILSTVSMVTALNAKIGNGRVVLHLKTGEVVNRTIKVINDNNVSVRINLKSEGDLKDYVNFYDENFTLSANEEKDAKYSIKAAIEGETKTQINVMFTPVEGKNGIVLPATIIIFADKTGTGNISYGDPILPEENSSGIWIIVAVIVIAVFAIILAIYFKKSKKGKLNEKKKEN